MGKPARNFSRNLRRLPIPAAATRCFAAATAAYALLPGMALASPTGGVVVGGSASIGHPSPTGTVIDQTSQSAIINWQQFNIAGNEYVQFVQPSASSVVLNRIIGGSPSEIFGSLSANGRVFLINPSGIMFAPGAQLDVGSLFASTMDIKNSDFMSGKYVFAATGAAGGTVTNAGTIKAGDGGFVVLAGDYVKNTGIVQARLGQVVLASGSQVTMGLDNSGLVSFAVDNATLAKKAGVDNAGQLLADGGRVVMTAKTARDLVGSAVNNTGLVRAQGIAEHAGEIELTASGGDITDSGTLDASSTAGAGGTIDVHGDANIDIQAGAQVLASGATQGGAVQIVADGNLNTRAGSLIKATAAAGKGGTAELSGHAKLTMRGAVDLGKGGTLSLDPTNLTIAAGGGSSSSATVYQNFVQSELQRGTNVNLVATNNITLANLGAGGLLNGHSANNGGGSLLLGIGTLSGQTYIEGSGGTIDFLNTANGIVVDGTLTLDAGSTTGSVNVGNLSGGVVDIKANDGITVGAVTATNGSISLSANHGAIAGGSLSATAIGSANSETADIVVNAGGAVNLLNVSATAQNQGSVGATSANALVRINANTANLGGNLAVGNITAQATANFGAAGASVALLNQNSGANVGTLSAGSILTSASAALGADGSVALTNDNGAIKLGTQSITTNASGTSANGAITLNAYGAGGISAGAITAGTGAIYVNTGAGNVGLGSVTASRGTISLYDSGGNIVAGNLLAQDSSGTSTDAHVVVQSAGGIQLGSVTTSANVDGSGDANASVVLQANYFGTAGGDLVAGPISTRAQSGGSTHTATASVYLSNGKGNVNVNDGQGGAGSIHTVARGVNRNDDITLYAYSGGGISTGNLGASNGAVTASTSGGGGITLGALSGASSGYGGQLTTVDIYSSGALAIGGSNVTANSIALTATAGSFIFGGGSGTLTATNGRVAVTVSAGDLKVGAVTATKGNIMLSDTGGSLFAGDIADNGGSVGLYATTGSITAGNIFTQSQEYGGSANASVTVYSRDAVTLGSITTDAEVLSGNGGANASVDLQPGYYGGGGDLSAGTISTRAVSGGSNTANAGVHVSVNGNLNLGANSITAVALGAGTNFSDVSLTAYSAGNITVGNVNTNGSINARTAGAGNIALGALSGANSYGAPAVIDVNAGGSLAIGGKGIQAGTISLSAAAGNFSFAGNISATSGALSVADSGGNLVLGNLAAGQGGMNLTASQGSISAGNISVTAISSGGSANAHLTALAKNGIQLGMIATSAQSLTSNHNANAAVDLEADYYGNGSGDLVTGPISTSASHSGSGGASAAVYLYDGNGNINLGANGITTAASGPSANNDITLTAYNSGSITAGAISGGGANLAGYTNGNIALGALSGSSHAALASVRLQSGGTLSVGGSSITAGRIALTAGAGDFIFGGGTGTLTATSGAISVYDSAGSLGLGAVSATGGGITLSDTGGNLTVGNVTAHGGSISLAAYNGSIAAGNLLAQTVLSSGTAIASIVAQANNSLTVGSVTTDAEFTGAGGNAYASVKLYAGNFGGSGQLTVGGAIGTTALAGPGGYADGSVNLSNSHGGIDPPPLVGITTDAAGAGFDGDITLTASGGDIVFGNLTATNAAITVTNYSGNISLGALSGGAGAGDELTGVNLNSAGTLVLATPSIQAGSISLIAGAGDLNFGTLTATRGSVNVAANGGNLSVGDVSADNGGSASSATIVLDAAGNITAGALSTHAVNTAGATADINVNSGGSIAVGAITASAMVTGPAGSASADVQLTDYSAASPVGDISVSGAISTSAVSAGAGYSADGHVTIYNHDGGIDTHGNSITTNASGAGISGDITLTSYSSGNIATGNLTATDAGVVANTYYSPAGQGNIAVGLLSGGTGSLTQVQLGASGTLTLGGSSLTAGMIRLDAGAGDFTYGNLTSTAGNIGVAATNGSVRLGNLLAQDTQAGGAVAEISVYSAGGITTGSVTTNAVSTGSNGYAVGNVYLYANYYGNLGGDLAVGGPLSANATAAGATASNSATADVYLSNGSGSGNGGSVRTGGITATAAGARYLQDSISVYAGKGGIDTGDITAGAILLQSSGLVGVGSHSYGVFTGNLSARDRAGVYIDAGTGDIELASVNVNNAATGSYGGATAYIYANTGGVDIAGTVDVLAAQRQSTLSVYAGKDIHLHGAVTVSGGGGSGSYYSNPATMAQATLHAAGNVIVDGMITVAGSAFNAANGSGNSRYRGDGVLDVSGGSVSLGDVAVSGVGNASINVSAGTTMVLGSVSASAMRDRSVTISAGRTTLDEGGLALINLMAGSGADASHIQTGGLSASGPNAVVNVQAGTLDLRNGGNGKAVSVTAYSGGSSDGGSGAYYRTSYGGAPVVASDFGAAKANLLARDNQGGTGIVSGGIAVAGPEALLQLVSRNDITVTGDLSAQGLGYTITGDGTQLPSPYLIGTPQQPLLLNTGTTTWGRASLLVGGSSYGSAGAGNVAINGNVAVDGIGEGLVKVLAGSLTVGGVTATAAAGTLHGTQTSTIYTGSNAGYTVTRSYSDGSGGAAQYGRASAKFVIGSASGDVTLNSLTVQGASEANAAFDGGRNITISGNALVANNLSGSAAVYDEAVTFSPFGGASPVAAADTHIVGGEATLAVGFHNGVLTPVGSFTAGGVELDGYGFVGTVID
ncbi:MAG: filamentous hemagglutinin N-terminal domain-containing protein, partial [Nevskia sp.]|nr:filamentous hemagglutinin N-terminal domain-containing protein [Nevskia sp.]